MTGTGTPGSGRAQAAGRAGTSGRAGAGGPLSPAEVTAPLPAVGGPLDASEVTAPLDPGAIAALRRGKGANDPEVSA